MTELRIEYLHEEIERLTRGLESLNLELASLLHVNIVCTECGSDDVLLSASVRWDVETQEYNVANIYDGEHECGTCGHLCDITRVPI